MSKRSLTGAQKRLIIERSGGLCEYCKCPEDYSLKSFDFDHILPESKGGPTSPENIAYACGGCNGYKHAKTGSIDPDSGVEADLFNPRQERWEDHFRWSEDVLTIVGLTPTGRATVQALQLNRRGVVNIPQAVDFRWRSSARLVSSGGRSIFDHAEPIAVRPWAADRCFGCGVGQSQSR